VNCEEVKALVDGYLDGELDPVTNQSIEGHLRECPLCDRAFKEHQALVVAIGAVSPYHGSPAGLRERIQSALREQILQSRHGLGSKLPHDVRTERGGLSGVLLERPWNWLGLAAALVVAGLIAWNLAPLWRRPVAEQFLATQLLASHVRSLMVDHLTDVASTDQHTVKPWFDGKLDFAPSVANPAGDGFPLVGGRLDYLDDRPVAALVYQRRKHLINIFIWPLRTDETKDPSVLTLQGYHLLHWVDSGLNYWAVSDVGEGDLVTLRDLLKSQTSQR
jgi:anti-sigma factor RsiW